MNLLSDRDRSLTAFTADELPEDIRRRGNQAIDDLVLYLASLFEGDTDVPQEHPYFLEELHTMRMGPEWMDRLLAHGYERTSIKRFLQDVASAAKKNPLYVVVAAEIASTADWKAKYFPAESEQTHDDLKRTITYGVLLDMVAHVCLKEPMRAGATAPPTFVKQLYDHLAKQRKEIDWKPYCESFVRLKIQSVSIGVATSWLPYKENFPRPAQGLEDGDVVSANILEAVITDLNNGFDDNAVCGTVLMRHPVNRDAVEGLRNARSEAALDYGNLNCKPALPRQWNNLYSSWNMAFGTGTFRNWVYGCAKLLNPTVAGAYHTEDEGLYLAPRCYTLWFHLHWYAFVRAKRRSIEPRGANWRNTALTNLWGFINKAAARSYEVRVQEILDRHYRTQVARAKAETAIHADFERIWVMARLLCYSTGTSKQLNLGSIRPRITAMIDNYQPPSTAHRFLVWVNVCWGFLVSLVSLYVKKQHLALVAVGVVVVLAVILRH